MNLRNGNITVAELMRNAQARQLLSKEFPGVIGSPMFRMAQGMSLNQVLKHVSRKVPPQKISSVIKQLQEI